jgi:putative membrane protein
MHEKVLRQLDDQLIPSADNAELRQLLTATRATVSSHLEQARQIQAQLGGRTGTDSSKHE